MTRILAATDLSDASRHAVNRAGRLAAELGCPLHLTHAITPGLFDDIQRLLAPNAPPLSLTLGNDANRQLQEIAGELARAGDSAIDCRVVFGQPVDALLEQAEANAADLLVVGSRGEGFLRQLTIGSTALRLLRKTQRPTLVVKNPVAGPYRRALVAMDFSPAALAALHLLRQIAPQAELVLLHAVEIPFERQMHYAGVNSDVIQQYRTQAQMKAMQQLRQLADDEQMPETTTHLLAPSGNPTDLILEQVDIQDCDLIVVGKRGLHIVEELLLGSTTKHLLIEADTDILIASD
ncbi:MAG: universal stress protein [Azonexus sp.]|jgi:nucleotide-binding universal stress UspA family protein|uniref:universal stress protein n=1 Tax=Azonexus sp. TaxID=1872668 RepID=UPI00282CEB0A|nr:universal stress protein [Azonexus sp.]MDR0776433.1 universal stress protein [Azonexus sp.]